ncbi:MAG: hypothetical protein ACREVI_16130 [Steroidobacteraceae bacterium]
MAELLVAFMNPIDAKPAAVAVSIDRREVGMLLAPNCVSTGAKPLAIARLVERSHFKAAESNDMISATC